jgi:hypothetical protein
VALVCGLLLAEAAHRLILLEVWTGIEWDRTYMQVAVADIVGAGVALLVLRSGTRWRRLAVALPLVALAGLTVFSAGDVMLRFAAGAAR